MLIGEALDEFFKRPYVAARVAEGRIKDTYRIIVGDEVADQTTEIRLENHILHIKLSSSLLRQELFYQRDGLRDEINRLSKIKIVNAVIVK